MEGYKLRIAVAALRVGPQDLINDLATFGLFFETKNVMNPKSFLFYFWGSLQKDSFLIRIASRWRYRSYRYAR